MPNTVAEEGQEVCNIVVTSPADPIFPVTNFSSLTRLKRVTAWIFRFGNNCRARRKGLNRVVSPLTADELSRAENTVTKGCYKPQINVL